MARNSPTKEDTSEQKAPGRLLSTESRDACERVAAGTSLWSQRAQALLAVDEGATQAEAGERAGLTLGQVRYWLGKFRSDQLSIFPESELALDTAREEKKKKKKCAANRSRRKSGKKRKS